MNLDGASASLAALGERIEPPKMRHMPVIKMAKNAGHEPLFAFSYAFDFRTASDPAPRTASQCP